MRLRAKSKCARAALAHDFISELPQGYDTIVGERGIFRAANASVWRSRALLIDACPDTRRSDLGTDAESEQLVHEQSAI